MSATALNPHSNFSNLSFAKTVSYNDAIFVSKRWESDISSLGYEARFSTTDIPLLVSCEHAGHETYSENLSIQDRTILKSHWGWDKGAAEVAKEIAMHFGAFSILGRQSRLVCDLNRLPSNENWIRTEVSGHPLAFNRKLERQEIIHRHRKIFLPYHKLLHAQAAIHKSIGKQSSLISVHSMTPVFKGEIREMDLAVVHGGCQHEAESLAAVFESAGLKVAINKPYSGLEGELSPLHKLSFRHKMPVLWLELNQRCLRTPAESEMFGKILAKAMEGWVFAADSLKKAV